MSFQNKQPHYFTVLQKKQQPHGKNFTAECKFYPKRVISGNINNSSNFLKHIWTRAASRWVQTAWECAGSHKSSYSKQIPWRRSCRQPRLHLHSATSMVSQSDFEIPSNLTSLLLLQREKGRRWHSRIVLWEKYHKLYADQIDKLKHEWVSEWVRPNTREISISHWRIAATWYCPPIIVIITKFKELCILLALVHVTCLFKHQLTQKLCKVETK